MVVGFLFRVHYGVDWWVVVVCGVGLELLVGLGLGDFEVEIWWVDSLRKKNFQNCLTILKNTPFQCINNRV